MELTDDNVLFSIYKDELSKRYGIKAVHPPTGIFSVCEDDVSLEDKKEKALILLKKKIDSYKRGLSSLAKL